MMVARLQLRSGVGLQGSNLAGECRRGITCKSAIASLFNTIFINQVVNMLSSVPIK